MKPLFLQKMLVQQTLPTLAALVGHIKRAFYQSGHIARKALEPNTLLPSPTDWWLVKTRNDQAPLDDLITSIKFLPISFAVM